MPALRFDRQAVPPAAGWLAGAAAASLIRDEQRQLAPLLARVHGARGLYLGPDATAPDTLSGVPVGLLVRVHLRNGRLAGDLVCELDRLPLQDDSLSLCCMLHAFEQIEVRSGLASELARVLRPEGTAVIVTLNPLSPWSLCWRRSGPSALRPAVITGLLRGAGLQVVSQRGLGSVAPRTAPAAPRGDGPDPLAPLRGAYAVIARKRREGMTLQPQARAVAIGGQARAG